MMHEDERKNDMKECCFKTHFNFINEIVQMCINAH